MYTSFSSKSALMSNSPQSPYNWKEIAVDSSPRGVRVAEPISSADLMLKRSPSPVRVHSRISKPHPTTNHNDNVTKSPLKVHHNFKLRNYLLDLDELGESDEYEEENDYELRPFDRKDKNLNLKLNGREQVEENNNYLNDFMQGITSSEFSDNEAEEGKSCPVEKIIVTWRSGIKAKGSSWRSKAVTTIGQDMLVLGGSNRSNSQLYICDTTTLQWSGAKLNGRGPEEAPFYMAIPSEDSERLLVLWPASEHGSSAIVTVSYESKDPSKLCVKKGQKVIVDMDDIQDDSVWVNVTTLDGDMGFIPISCLKLESSHNYHSILELSILNFSANMTWSSVTCSGEFLPQAREFFTCVAKENNVYLFGGRTENGELSNSIFKLDLNTYQWDHCQSFGSSPTPRYAHTSVLSSSQEIVIFGGLDMKGNYLNDMYGFNLETQTWRVISSIGAPRARAFHQMTKQGDYLIVYGGRNSSTVFSDVHAYHIQFNLWIPVIIEGEEPSGRFLHFFDSIGDNRMILFGGKDKESQLFDLFHLDMQEIKTESITKPIPPSVRSLKWSKSPEVSPEIRRVVKDFNELEMSLLSPPEDHQASNTPLKSTTEETLKLNVPSQQKTETKKPVRSRTPSRSSTRRTPTTAKKTTLPIEPLPPVDRSKYEALLRDELLLKDELHRIFMYYCSYGNKMNLDYLSSAKFKMFVKDIKVSRYGIKPEEVDLMYLKILTTAAKKKQKKQLKTNSAAQLKPAQQRMDFDSFFETLKELAKRCFSEEPFSNALIQLLVSHILPFAKKVADIFGSIDMEDETIQSVVAKHRQNLQKIFLVYSSIESFVSKTMHGTHMNCNELFFFASDFNLVPKLASKKDIFRILRSCASALSPDELTYDQFEEFLVKYSQIAYSKHPYNSKYPKIHDKVQGILDRIDIKDIKLVKKKLEKLGRNTSSLTLY